MNARRLKALRLAHGLTLDQLADEMGGLVTKQALSKYELGLVNPSPRVLVQLARALKVKAIELTVEPRVQVQVLGFRKRAAFPRTMQKQIESEVLIGLERRVALQERVGQACASRLPVGTFPITRLEQTEEVAESLRGSWELGLDPIARVMDMLEDHCVHVIEVDAPETFDGMSAMASSEGEPVAAAVVTRRGVSGERQRLNLTHELGHIILVVPDDVDEEKAAFRFGAALLAPRAALYSEVGSRRSDVREEELLILKRRFGLSMQALVFRLHDLNIISARHYQDWWKYINSRGWKKSEPEELAPEQPSWLRQSTLRALSEGLVTSSEAESLLGCPLEPSGPVPRRKAMAHLSADARRGLLEKQAQAAADHYATEADDDADDDVVEY